MYIQNCTLTRTKDNLQPTSIPRTEAQLSGTLREVTCSGSITLTENTDNNSLYPEAHPQQR